MPAPPWHRALVLAVRAVWVLAVPAAILGFSRHGCPLWTDARALFVPAGFAFIANALLVLARIDRSYEKPGRFARLPMASGMVVVGLAFVGVGANYLHRAAGFRALAAPVGVLFALHGLALMVYGRGAQWPGERAGTIGGWGRFPRGQGFVLFLIGAFGVAAALSAVKVHGNC